MKSWWPEIRTGGSPVYERLIEAMQEDVRGGVLAPGDRLPPHRDLAHRLSLSVGTVSRAYVEAERRGLVSSHVGRGTFIAERAALETDAGESGLVDMAHNTPPAAPARAWIGEALTRIRHRTDMVDSLGYAQPDGLPAIREAGAAWLQRRHRVPRATAGRILQCNGGQHGLALAFGAFARAGDTILCEATTYPGIRTLAEHGGYRLKGVAMDARGIDPEAIARAARDTGAKVLVLIPTLQNPTTITLDPARRAEIVAVARAHDLTIVEDEAYRVFAGEDAPDSLAALAPERTLMIACVSKSIAPGLRLGFILPPEREGARDRLLHGIRALGYSPPSLGGLVFSQWEQDGSADRIADEVRAEAAVRTRLALDILGNGVAAPGAPQSLHVWMPMPLIEAERLTARALRAGIALTPPDGPAVDPDGPSGVRLCLGAVPGRTRLETALRSLRDMVDAGTCRSAMGLV